MDVWVAGDDWPYTSGVYTVVVDGQVYETITLMPGHPPLTHREKVDMARYYQRALEIFNAADKSIPSGSFATPETRSD